MPQLQEIDPAPFIESGNIQGWLTQLGGLLYKYQWDAKENEIPEISVEACMGIFREQYAKATVKPVLWSEWLWLFEQGATEAMKTAIEFWPSGIHARTVAVYWTAISILLCKGVKRNAITS